MRSFVGFANGIHLTFIPTATCAELANLDWPFAFVALPWLVHLEFAANESHGFV